jgi:uncharacterized membrane protein
LTVLPPFNAFGYGPVQVRVSEALSVLPFVLPWAPWGLYIGCLAANLVSPFMIYDITVGAGATLFSAFLTRKMPNKKLAPLPPVIVNALVVPAYIAPLMDMNYLLLVVYIGIGQLIACYVIGYPLLSAVINNKRLVDFLRGE